MRGILLSGGISAIFAFFATPGLIRLLAKKGYGQISDEGKISAVVDDVIKMNQKQVAEYKSGKEVVLKFLVGMVMRATEGSADPITAEKLLKEKMK
mgnify:CR=1 FL=1